MSFPSSLRGSATSRRIIIRAPHLMSRNLRVWATLPHPFALGGDPFIARLHFEQRDMDYGHGFAPHPFQDGGGVDTGPHAIKFLEQRAGDKVLGLHAQQFWPGHECRTVRHNGWRREGAHR